MDPTTSMEQFEYREAFGLVDNSISLFNLQYPNITVRGFKSFIWNKEKVEECLETIGRKVKFKYPDELEFYGELYKKIDKVLTECGF